VFIYIQLYVCEWFDNNCNSKSQATNCWWRIKLLLVICCPKVVLFHQHRRTVSLVRSADVLKLFILRTTVSSTDQNDGIFFRFRLRTTIPLLVLLWERVYVFVWVNGTHILSHMGLGTRRRVATRNVAGNTAKSSSTRLPSLSCNASEVHTPLLRCTGDVYRQLRTIWRFISQHGAHLTCWK